MPWLAGILCTVLKQQQLKEANNQLKDNSYKYILLRVAFLRFLDITYLDNSACPKFICEMSRWLYNKQELARTTIVVHNKDEEGHGSEPWSKCT